MSNPTIEIRSIPHKEQRLLNGDIGDYFLDENGHIIIAASNMGNFDYTFLIQLHEFVEHHLIRRKGLPIDAIDKWDNEHPDEMGEHPQCPYRDEHLFAEAVERLVASYMKISWSKYEKRIQQVSEKKRYDLD